MAEDINSTTLGGRLGADAETRMFESGKSKTTFRMATTTGYGDHEGTLWTTVEVWSAPDWMQDAMTKGARVVVVNGAWYADEWTDRESGEKRSKQILKARSFDVHLFDRPPRDTERATSRRPDATPEAPPAYVPPRTVAESQAPDDEIPF